MSDNNTDREAGPSKSCLKRKAHAQQALGERLTRLNNRQFRTLELPEALLEAIEEFHHLPQNHSARRRQLQFIGKLMRDIDQSGITEQLKKLEAPTQFKPEPTPAEVCTEEFLRAGSPDIECLLRKHSSLDRKKLWQLKRRAIKARNTADQEKIRQQLITYLSDYL